MDDLIEKVDELKKCLDKEMVVQEIKELNKKLQDDNELFELIKNYHETREEKLKSQILESSLFREYKEKEIELNLLILELNKQLKKITEKDNCIHESN